MEKDLKLKIYKNTILVSSYRCDPFGVSESNTAFKWLQILLKKFNICLLTTLEGEKSIIEFYGTDYPKNLCIISFSDNYIFKSKKVMRDGIKLGYFLFNNKIKKYLSKNPDVINNCDIIFQKTPESFRYFTSLTKFSKPVYIGPLSGGLKPPSTLKKYFRRESIFHKLRNLDSYLLKLPVYKIQFSKIKKVIVCFDYIEDILPHKYLLNKKLLLNSGIDCSQYLPFSKKRTEKFKILYVGRLTRYKGAELLIRALNNIKNLDFQLEIIGDGEERDYLQKLVKELKMENKIMFYGFLEAEKVRKFYESASIFCFPTLTEAVGIVFYEAMASGLPIITIDNGGPKYICPENGAIKIPITSEKGIVKDLQESIRYLMENPKKREEMGTFNRDYCLKNYDWKILEKNILSFFEEELITQSCK